MGIPRLTQWLTTQALPLWGSVGFDDHTGQFVEEISHSSEAITDTPRRLMVQARQIYVFSQAHHVGWYSGKSIALTAYNKMIELYAVEGKGNRGWAFSVDRSGNVVDSRRDLYAHAFVLLALASIKTLTGDNRAIDLAHETLDFLDSDMSMVAGGYAESKPIGVSVRRRQNPHMHLLEGLLALHAASPGDGFDRRATELIELLKSRFVVGNSAASCLVEYFDDDLNALGGPDYTFEPGHHFEWVWLLAEYERLTGRGEGQLATSLWEMAVRHGFRADHVIWDEVAISGDVRCAGTRLWPLTEALKAMKSQYGAPYPISENEIEDALMNVFIESASAGLWKDHFDASGNLMRKHVPASSLYHITCAALQY